MVKSKIGQVVSYFKDSASQAASIPPLEKCPESAPLGLGLEHGKVLFEKAKFGQGTCISRKPYFGSPGPYEPSRGVAVFSPDKELRVEDRSCAPGVHGPPSSRRQLSLASKSEMSEASK